MPRLTAPSRLAAPLLLSLAALAGLAACEVTDPLEDVNLVLDVDDVVTTIDPVALAVRPDVPTVALETISPELADIEEIRDLEAVHLAPRFFAFTPSAGKAGSARASGTVALYVFFGDPLFPLPGMPVRIRIEDDAVVDVTPSTLGFGDGPYVIDEAAVDALLDRLGNLAPPVGPYETATLEEVEAAVNAALQATSTPIGVALRVVEGDLDGSLVFTGFLLDAEVALAR